MSRRLIGLLAMTVAATLAAVPVAARQDAGPTITRGMAVDRDASIRLFNLSGSVRVIGWDRDSIAVTGTIAPGGGRFFMGGGRRGVKMGIETPGEDVATIAPTTLELRVPAGARVWVKGSATAMTVTAMRGELDLSTVSGALSVTGSPSQVTAESMNGRIEIAGATQIIRAKTADGEIVVRGAGGDLAVSTVSGPIRVLAARRVLAGRVESVSGAITFTGDVASGGTLDLQTHDAPIYVTLSPGQSAVVDVSAFRGRFTNGLASAKRGAANKWTRRFTLGTGDALVAIRSLKGDVTVRAEASTRPRAGAP